MLKSEIFGAFFYRLPCLAYFYSFWGVAAAIPHITGIVDLN